MQHDTSKVERPPVKIGKLSYQRIPALDGVRGLAILFVLLYHISDQFMRYVDNPFDFAVINAGLSFWIGVDLFFVLSGFLITGILYDTRESRNYLKNFYARRTLRIFPLYYLTLTILCIIAPRVHPFLAQTNETLVEHQWWYWTYLSNFLIAWEGGFSRTAYGFFWSLAVEEQFYLVWPWFVWSLSGRRLITLSIMAIIASTVARCSALAFGEVPTVTYVLPFTHIEALLIGSVIAITLRLPGGWKNPRRPLLVAGLFCLLGIFAIAIYEGQFCFWNYGAASIGLTLVAGLFGCLLWLVVMAQKKTMLSRVFTHPFLMSFGKYSYALYLCHIPIYRASALVFAPQEHIVAGSIFPSLLLFVMIATSLCWIVAFASWHLFEKHFVALKKHFSYDSP